MALGVGFTRNHSGYVHRIYSDTDEDTLTLTADAVSLPWGTIRAEAEFSDRTGSDLDEASLVQIGEQPKLRHYDVANRQRRKFTGQLDLFPSDVWSLSFNAGVGNDDYDESYFGVQESSFRVAGVSFDVQRPDGLGAGASYNYERYAGLHRSRSASPGAEFEDPNRDWTTDSTENVHYFSLYLTPPKMGRNTEARFVLRLLECARELRLRHRSWRPVAGAKSAAGGLQHPAGAARGGPPSIVEEDCGLVFVRIRAVPRLRLRDGSQRDRRHRATQLAGPGVRLQALHDEFRGGEPAVLLLVRRWPFWIGG